ncbi:MAG: flagellar export chaperone FlgN [Acidimicrobiales bacterium]
MESGTRAALERLALCLGRQVASLRHLCFKFEIQEVVLTSGRQKWLGETTAELELAVADLHEHDQALRVALVAAAVAVGLSPESTVREVAARVPEPWSYVLEEHRKGMHELLERVGQLSRTNRQMLARGHAATVAAMSFLGAQVSSGYDASGRPSPASGSVGLLDARA